ncbi:hypothetical protein SprV_0100260800 [Sparganum proliferum]
MGLFGYMRIHESGIDRNLGTPNTSSAPSVYSPALTPPPSAPTVTSSITPSARRTPTTLSPIRTPSTIASATIITVTDQKLVTFGEATSTRSGQTYSVSIEAQCLWELYKNVLLQLTNNHCSLKGTSTVLKSAGSMVSSNFWIQRAYRRALYITGLYFCDRWEQILFFTLFFGFVSILLLSAFVFIPSDAVAFYSFLRSRLQASGSVDSEL